MGLVKKKDIPSCGDDNCRAMIVFKAGEIQSLWLLSLPTFPKRETKSISEIVLIE